MSIEAMKLALQYIEANAETKDEHEIATGLRQAIREHAIYEMQRLGQEIEQEPVAYMYESVCGNDFITRCAAPSYAKNIRPLYTHPPQRTWVGLTDEEIKSCWHEACQTDLELTSQLVVYFAKAIEAKLKEKNT
jgi:hypothetical protein